MTEERSYFKDKEERQRREREMRNPFRQIPYPVLVTFLYLCLGFFLGLWHPGWLIFLTIPIHYIPAKDRTLPRLLASPVMVTLIYLILGTYFNLWHPGWLIFFCIPLFGAAVR